MAVVLLARYHFEGRPPPPGMVGRTTALFAALCGVLFLLARQHRTMWRFTTLNEVLRIAQAVVLADLLLLPILFLADRAQDFPRSTPLLVAPVLIAGLAFGRVLAHALAHGDLGAAFKYEDRALPPAVVVGGGRALAAYLTQLRRSRAASMRVAGLVTLDGAPFGRTIQGVEVLGDLRRLTSILKALAAAEDREPQLVLAEPRPGRELMEAVVASAGEAGGEARAGAERRRRRARRRRRPAGPAASRAGSRPGAKAHRRQAGSGDRRGRHHRLGADAPGAAVGAGAADPARCIGVQPLRRRPGAPRRVRSRRRVDRRARRRARRGPAGGAVRPRASPGRAPRRRPKARPADGAEPGRGGADQPRGRDERGRGCRAEPRRWSSSPRTKP